MIIFFRIDVFCWHLFLHLLSITKRLSFFSMAIKPSKEYLLYVHFSSVMITLIGLPDACICRFFLRSYSRCLFLSLSIVLVNFSTGRRHKRSYAHIHFFLRCSYLKKNWRGSSLRFYFFKYSLFGHEIVYFHLDIYTLIIYQFVDRSCDDLYMCTCLHQSSYSYEGVIYISHWKRKAKGKSRHGWKVSYY